MNKDKIIALRLSKKMHTQFNRICKREDLTKSEKIRGLIEFELELNK